LLETSLNSVRTNRGSVAADFVNRIFGDEHRPKTTKPAIELNVPFSQKDEAKKLGARWNPDSKKWFIPDGISDLPFQRWIEKNNPRQDTRPATQTMFAPVWLLTSYENCYCCHKNSSVFAITSQAIEDYDVGDENDVHYQTHRADKNHYVSISNLEQVDERIGQYLAKAAPNYRMDFSKTQHARVYMNHCEHCQAKLGDFYMHNEPGGAFYPDSYEDAQKMKQVIFELGQYPVKGSVGVTSW
jgi:hypothetical protein